jgi:hypothetical protein
VCVWLGLFLSRVFAACVFVSTPVQQWYASDGKEPVANLLILQQQNLEQQNLEQQKLVQLSWRSQAVNGVNRLVLSRDLCSGVALLCWGGFQLRAELLKTILVQSLVSCIALPWCPVLG